jgi:hypothetical protein
VDFSPIHIPATLPRVRIWKGNLIKVFSDMFIGTNGKYGAYPVSYLFFSHYSIISNAYVLSGIITFYIISLDQGYI